MSDEQFDWMLYRSLMVPVDYRLYDVHSEGFISRFRVLPISGVGF